MNNLQELLQTKAFWYFYQLGSEYALDEQLVKRFDLPKSDNKGYEPLRIRLECPQPFALDFDITLDWDVNLLLANRQQSKQSELGWWDDARWHPFALRWEQITAAYHELDLFSPEEVEELAEATLLKPPEDDYRWTRDAKLGWVFGGDYPCYSIRNAAHAGGAEGRFPFADWERLLESM
jgi:hypothetical protein